MNDLKLRGEVAGGGQGNLLSLVKGIGHGRNPDHAFFALRGLGMVGCHHPGLVPHAPKLPKEEVNAGGYPVGVGEVDVGEKAYAVEAHAPTILQRDLGGRGAHLPT